MKKVYLFDDVTGEYLGETFAQESPLEPGVFIKPHCSTEARPLAHEVGKYNFWNGVAWELKEDTRGFWFDSLGEKKEVSSLLFVIPNDWTREKLPKTLEELKEDKNAEINAARLSANQTTFTYQAKQVACDPLSRSDIDGINGYVATRGEMPSSWIGGWKATDNSIILIPDVPTWNAFYDSMIAQGQANFAKSESLKAQLAAAATPEQVEAISW